MDYNLRCNLTHIKENQFEMVIIVNLPDHHFLALATNKVEAGSVQREIVVTPKVIPEIAGENAEVTTGIFSRKQGEERIKVSFVDPSGNVLESRVEEY